jgi:hypothetical protein
MSVSGKIGLIENGLAREAFLPLWVDGFGSVRLHVLLATVPVRRRVHAAGPIFEARVARLAVALEARTVMRQPHEVEGGRVGSQDASAQVARLLAYFSETFASVGG